MALCSLRLVSSTVLAGQQPALSASLHPAAMCRRLQGPRFLPLAALIKGMVAASYSPALCRLHTCCCTMQAVATTLPAALGLKTPNAKTQSVTAFKRDSNAAKDLTQLVTAFKSDSNAAKDLTAPENKTRVIKTSAASENNTSVATNLTAFEDRMSPAKAPNVIPTATKGGNLQPELTKANLIVGPTGRTVDLRSYVSEQLAKPASFRGMSINALCVELQPRDLPGRVRPEDFKHRGAITVSTNDPDTFARKIAVQRRWEEQAEGGDLPRLSISSLSEVFACDWTALKLYVATPLDWGVNGPKAVTWGDMRVVAAFGIAAGAVQAPEAEGRGAASTAGMLAEAKAVC